MSDPMSPEGRAARHSRGGRQNMNREQLLDEVDRLTEALGAAEENVQRLRYSKELRDEEIDAQAARAERAEADLADEKRRRAAVEARLNSAMLRNIEAHRLRAGVEALADECDEQGHAGHHALLRALLDTATEEAQGAP